MKKIITLILAMMMMLSVVMTGCTTEGGDTGEGGTTAADVLYERGVTYSDNIGVYDVAARVETETTYDKNIFYRNDVSFNCPDPGVIYCNDRTNEECYDWYFLYGTTGSGQGSFFSYKSKDLVSWELAGPGYVWPVGGWQKDRAWAPEVIYDANADRAKYGLDDAEVYGEAGTGVYFMFASAVPNKENETTPYNYYSLIGVYSQYALDCAVATNPAGPFKAYNGQETGAIIDGVDYSKEENYAKFTTYADDYASGNKPAVIGRENNEITNDDMWWNNSASRASLKFQWDNRENAGKWVGNTGTSNAGQVYDVPTPDTTYVPEAAAWMVIDESQAAFCAIDPTPFIDPLTGDYYLFFTRDQTVLKGEVAEDNEVAFYGTSIYCCKMMNKDWTQPDYSTLHRVSRTRFTTLSQAAANAYNKDAEEFDASQYTLGYQEDVSDPSDMPAYFARSTVEDRIRPDDNEVNEGTQMQYNPDTGLYYITFSMGDYIDDTYTVIQCVSYNVTGPFRKLEVGEGGLFLATDSGKSLDNISGPGHHTMLEVYDEDLNREKELVIIYHKHLDMNVGGGERGPVVDRVVWTQNDEGMTIMHVNGPTTFIQPRLYSTGETPYDNLVQYDFTTVTVDEPDAVTSDKNGVENLYDNIIPIHSNDNSDGRPAAATFVNEFEATSEYVNITISFDEYKDVVAYMIYTGRYYDRSFRTFINTSGKEVNDIKRVEMDIKKDGVETTAVFDELRFYKDMAHFANQGTMKLRPGASANAVFAEVAVKEIRIEIKNPYYNKEGGKLALAEVVVLGRPGSSAANA